MLEMLGVPYVFSNVLASSLAMNKPKSKLFAKDCGLDVLPHYLLNKKRKFDINRIIDKIGLPVVVKPAELGSSVGMSIAKTSEELSNAIDLAFEYDDEIMLEKFIKGRELTCAIFGNNPPRALPLVEIIPKISEYFDFKAKYEQGGSEEICPADVPPEVTDRIQQDSIKIFEAIGCHDLARVDYIWDEVNQKYYFLEINTIPGMTQTSLVPQEAQAAGMDFSAFLDELIKNALKRKKE